MKIIITGVAGFIGYHLATYLCKNVYHVYGVDNFICGHIEHVDKLSIFPTFTFYKGSAIDSVVSDWITKDAILIHLAGISALATNQENPSFSYSNNVAITAGLVETCRIKGILHFIFASTSAVYENTTIFPTPENTVIQPDLIYSLGKYHAEEIIRSFGSIYRLPFTILRFFNVYGSHQDSIRTHPPLIPYLVKCFKNDTRPLLHSDGFQKRDYIHVHDVISFIQTILTHPTNDSYNVCTGTTTSVREIVDMIKKEMKVDTEPIYRDPSLLWEKSTVLWNGESVFPKERMLEEVTKYSCGDPSKAHEKFGWKSIYSLEEGIRELLINL
jgi:UDP-glucose 4-epimerase